jgi:para-nitrobenzyl esterase
MGLCVLAVAAALSVSLFAQGDTVKTANGTLRGVRIASPSVVAFKGIPFAAPPVGPLRWRTPQPVKPWTGVRPATDFAASCMQREVKELLPWTEEFMTHRAISEDCLFLNLWTPRLARSARLPVVVFIHGGAFTGGAGDIAVYDGEQLAATGLVVITINYRLGVFGFFSHPELTVESEHHSSGNYGLLDQIAALQWIKQNIAGFGGDPTRVTIWGQSAGAFSVAALVASPVAAGLFQRAMADIGIPGLPMANLKSAEDSGVKFASAHHAASLADLRALSADALLPGPQEMGPGASPIVDGWVLPDNPVALSSRAADNDVPVITGYQANDGALLGGRIQSLDNYTVMVKRRYGEMADDFLALYPAKTLNEARECLAQSSRDRERVSMYLWASRRAANHHQPVFTYFFDHAIPWPQHPEFGAFHTGEIPYFFLNLSKLDRPWTDEDRSLAKTAASYLKNFAATGDPSGTGLPKWPAVSSATPATMEIGDKLGPMPLSEDARLDFWIRFFNSPAAAHAPPF